ncbi:hypothetical protein SKAU_G00322110 [Synaphobranchus kaupii]|uniref:Uncharacterized protein n=1 Tax=Synaphobranchus kaupii TaxID=118154 RepID=A0A9Q1IHQ9_SYNKA|nr:hypothetical protein SKAU_G00322110 [Synaphobranchus kaupii]
MSSPLWGARGQCQQQQHTDSTNRREASSLSEQPAACSLSWHCAASASKPLCPAKHRLSLLHLTCLR